MNEEDMGKVRRYLATDEAWHDDPLFPVKWNGRRPTFMRSMAHELPFDDQRFWDEIASVSAARQRRY